MRGLNKITSQEKLIVLFGVLVYIFIVLLVVKDDTSQKSNTTKREVPRQRSVFLEETKTQAKPCITFDGDCEGILYTQKDLSLKWPSKTYNVFIGYAAGQKTGGSNNIYLGSQAKQKQTKGETKP